MTTNKKNREALLFGVSEYSAKRGGLQIIEKEIPFIADALSSKLHEDYRYNVTSYLNKDVTANLLEIFIPYEHERSTRELLLYFSGHGTIHNQESYFVTYGAERNNPGIKLSALATAIKSLHDSITQIFLILDFCHSGGILDHINIADYIAGSSKLSILTATRKTQLAETKNPEGKSFADYFVEALTNALPDKEDGEISFDMLAFYIKQKMKCSPVQFPCYLSAGYVPINKLNKKNGKKTLLPYSPNHFFTGRKETLYSIQNALNSNNNYGITQPQALSGLGGIGKTQTALEYCYIHLYKDTYQSILWVDSKNKRSFDDSYSKIANLLDLSPNNKDLEIEKLIDLVKQWLAKNSNWLMVLDNLEDPNLIKNKDKNKEYLPTTHQGHILITTQKIDLGIIAKIITLDKMDLNIGSEFLLKKIKKLPQDAPLDKANPHDSSLAKEIVKEMDGLPLALDQAGSYICQTLSSLQEYLDLYKNAKHAAKLRKNRGECADNHISVTATFQLVFKKVKKKSLTAAKLLEVCSFLDPDSIPEEIFLQHGSSLGNELATLVNDRSAFNEVLRVLSDYSLIKRNSSNQSLSIHRIVQLVVTDLLTEDNKKALINSLAKALWSLFCDDPQVSSTWSKYQKLLPSVNVFFEFAKLYQSKLIATETAYLFDKFGVYFNTQSVFTQSLDFLTLAIQIKKQHFDNNHLDIAQSLNNIGEVHRNQGNYDEALTCYNEALNIYENSPHYNKSDFATVLNNIAIIYGCKTKYKEALQYYKKALDIYPSNDRDNLNVAMVYNNIATVYECQGKYEKALEQYNEAKKIYTRHYKNGFKDNHLDIAMTFNNIGNIYYCQNNYDEALDYYRKALYIYEQYFTNNYPETRQYDPNMAMTLNNVGSIHYKQNDYEEALAFYNKALHIYKQCSVANHPDVAKALNNIGKVYEQQNNWSEALTNYQKALSIYQNNPDNFSHTTDVLRNIGVVYKNQGLFDEAIDSFTAVLRICGPTRKHNSVLKANVLENLVELFTLKNQKEKAFEYYEKALKICKKIFPANHPTIIKLSNLVDNK